MNLNDILSERLAIVGGTGSGKSYTARGLVERVLAKASGRVGIIDPTGVWWGLRLKPDGKSAGFPVILFGGDHSDVPLIETAGRVIAQAVASTHQSWIIDTSALKSKASERRFMLDFLDAIFETNREDITLVVDEADRFSPLGRLLAVTEATLSAVRSPYDTLLRASVALRAARRSAAPSAGGGHPLAACCSSHTTAVPSAMPTTPAASWRRCSLEMLTLMSGSMNETRLISN